MASNKANNAKDLEASTSSNQLNLKERKPNTEGAASTNMEKALAKRALFGSQHRRVGGRRSANCIIRQLPSRLSKVSLAEDSPEIGTSQVSF